MHTDTLQAQYRRQVAVDAGTKLLDDRNGHASALIRIDRFAKALVATTTDSFLVAPIAQGGQQPEIVMLLGQINARIANRIEHD